MKKLKDIIKEYNNEWCEQTDDGTYIKSIKDSVRFEEWLAQQIKDLLMSMPLEEIEYGNPGLEGFISGYNSHIDEIKKWRNKVLK